MEELKNIPPFAKLGDILVAAGMITEDQRNKTLAEQKFSSDKIGDLFIKLGYAVEEQVFSGLAHQMSMDFIDNDKLLEAPEVVVALIPEAFARENTLIAHQVENGTLLVAMIDPDDIIAIDNLQKLTDQKVIPALGTPTGINKAIEQLYVRIRKDSEVKDVIEDLQILVESEDEEDGMVDMTKTETEIDDAPVVKLVNLIIADALKERATDIHIEYQDKYVVVRYRIDGVLMEVMTPPHSSHAGIISRIKIISRLNIAEKRLPQDGRFGIKTTDREVDVRVSILPTINGEKIVLRLLDKSTFSRSLVQLGFEIDMLKIFKRTIIQPYGMIVVSGPTGSGKSTTLYASISDIKSSEDNITTVEDPVEYHSDGINQVQVKPKIGLTFSLALRHILRQDPDKLLIGEIRDGETADIAIKFSLTGHIVFTTLHANDAPSTITRFIDIGVPPFLVGSCLLLVMAQRLVRKICPKCRIEYEPDEYEMAALNLSDNEKERYKDIKYYRGKGCIHCRSTGYFDRTGIFELLEIKGSIRRMIFDNANQEEIRDEASRLGMVSLREAALRKIAAGVTTLREVLRVTVQEYE
ncbi:Flp pilus assembly complex ATPase component TadA [bacterium]|nr:Flp pilus assembly complex ATPase component TadA [bacterium]